MTSTLIIAAALLAILIISVIAKGALEKARIEKARRLIDLQDDQRRLQNMLSAMPAAYLDKATRLLIYQELIHLLSVNQKISGTSTQSQQDEIEGLAEKAKLTPDSPQRLAQWVPLTDPDAAQEIRLMLQNLHRITLRANKESRITRSHAAAVIKNIKIVMYRLPIDLNYGIGNAADKMGQQRKALGKFKVARGAILKSPVAKYLRTQQTELENRISQLETALEIDRKNKAKNTTNSLSEGMDKLAEEEAWETKKQLYD